MVFQGDDFTILFSSLFKLKKKKNLFFNIKNSKSNFEKNIPSMKAKN